MAVEIKRSIILIDETGRHQQEPPESFDWNHYPEELEARWGRKYRYIGTIDGAPHYSTLET